MEGRVRKKRQKAQKGMSPGCGVSKEAVISMKVMRIRTEESLLVWQRGINW